MNYTRSADYDAMSYPQISHRLALLLSASVIASAFMTQSAFGQTVAAAPAPPIVSPSDMNGVNLMNGQPAADLPVVTIGNGQNSSMAFNSVWTGYSWTNPYYAAINLGTSGQNSIAVVMLGGKSVNFTLAGSVYVARDGTGGTLVSVSGGFVYTDRGGTVVNFTTSFGSSGQAVYNGTVFAIATSMVSPSGENTNFHYGTAQTSCGSDCILNYVRLQSVQNSSGEQLELTYQLNSVGLPQNQAANLVKWQQLNQVVAINTSVDYCDPTAVSCGTLAHSWPTLTYNFSTSGTNYLMSVADPTGATTKVTLNASDQLISIVSANLNSMSYQYDANYRISSLTRNGVNYTYAFTTSGSNMTGVLTGPNGAIETSIADTATGALLSLKDGLGNTKSYVEDTYGRITRATYPEGDYQTFAYDGRGNVTQATAVAKSGSGLANIILNSGYDGSCALATKCNQSNWTKDALGNETDYTYDPASGLPTSVTAPAAASGGIRPQTRYTYTQMQGYYMNSAGSIVASGVNTYALTGTSTCRTTAGTTLTGSPGVGPFALSGTATCAGTSDETKTTTSYGAQTAGTANNLWPVSQISAAGDSSLSATVSQAYDSLGNVITSNGPLGAGQVAYSFYDANRRLTGTINPDPDGSGPRTPSAIEYTYNVDGFLGVTSIGTVPNQASSLTSYVESYHYYRQIDQYDRVIRTTTYTNGIDYQVVDYLFDNMSRLYCSIQYMNPTTWGPQASSCAPAQTTGPFGPDRISQVVYDADNRVLKKSDNIATMVTNTYSPDGYVTSVKDGNSNLTSYTFDGFNRRSQVNFPQTTVGTGISNTGDYETFSYDANGHPLTRRLRDNNVLTFTYDNLGRLVTRTPSGTAASSSNDYPITMNYNLINAVTQIQRAADGVTLSYNYDALGRLTTETQPFGAPSFQYDAAGQRTRITWSDGFYAGYTYDMAGGLTSVAANGATSGVGVLASYAYNNLGNRTGVVYGNGTSHTYGYDAVARPISHQLTLPGASSYNEAITIPSTCTYESNTSAACFTPTSQIASIIRSNDSYAWTGAYNVSRAYITNGLNQYTSSGGVSLGYDARGNLTSSGTTTYTYDKLNDLVTEPAASVSIGYDSLGRVAEYDTTVSTRFYYAGSVPVAEVANPSGTVMQRYVPGAGTDEVVAWYSGSGNTTTPQFLATDERGSVIAVTNSTGGLVGTNSYDEFGIPASTNVGRFGYTGQTWFPEIGLYNYKARWYSPNLGRFMQTDPIGYGDGLSWYNYTHGDPVNGSDPTGLVDQVTAPGPVVNGQKPDSPIPAVEEIVVTAHRSAKIADEGGLIKFHNYRITGIPQLMGTGQDVKPCPSGPTFNLGGGGSATGFLGILGISGGGGATVSVPTASLPIVGDGSFRGTQVTGSLSITPLAGLGLFAGIGPNYSIGGSASSTSKGFTSSVTPVLQVGAGDGLGFEVTSDLTSPLNLGAAAGRIAKGIYGAVGARFQGNLSTGPIGC